VVVSTVNLVYGTLNATNNKQKKNQGKKNPFSSSSDYCSFSRVKYMQN